MVFEQCMAIKTSQCTNMTAQVNGHTGIERLKISGSNPEGFSEHQSIESAKTTSPSPALLT